MRALRAPCWPVEPRSDASLFIGARFKKWFKEYTWVQYTSCLWPFVCVPLTEAVGLFCQFLKYEKDSNELTIRSRPDALTSPYRKVPSAFISPRQIALLWFPFICPSAPACTRGCTPMLKNTDSGSHALMCPVDGVPPISAGDRRPFRNLREIWARLADRWVGCAHTCHPMCSDATSLPHVWIIRKRHKDMDVIWSDQRKRRIFLMWNICRIWVRSVTTHRE